MVWVGVEPDALLGSSSVMKSRVKIATTALSSTINLLIPLASPSPFDVSIRHSTFSSCIKHTFCTVGDSVAVILVFSLLLSGPAEAFTSAKMYGLMTLVGMGYWVFLIVLVWCSFLFYYSWKRWISEKNGNGLLLDPLQSWHSCLACWWEHMLAIHFCSFLLSFGRRPTAASPTCISMRGDTT